MTFYRDDRLASYLLIPFTELGRALVYKMTWELCTRLRIFLDLGLIVIGPCSGQTSGVESSCLWMVSALGDQRVAVVETVSKPTSVFVTFLLSPFNLIIASRFGDI